MGDDHDFDCPVRAGMACTCHNRLTNDTKEVIWLLNRILDVYTLPREAREQLDSALWTVALVHNKLLRREDL